MYGNVRHVNLYFRNVSGNLESSETARRHTAWESYVSVAYHGRWRQTELSTLPNDFTKYVNCRCGSTQRFFRAEVGSAACYPVLPIIFFFWRISQNEKGTTSMLLSTTMIQTHTQSFYKLLAKKRKNIFHQNKLKTHKLLTVTTAWPLKMAQLVAPKFR